MKDDDASDRAHRRERRDVLEDWLREAPPREQYTRTLDMRVRQFGAVNNLAIVLAIAVVGFVPLVKESGPELKVGEAPVSIPHWIVWLCMIAVVAGLFSLLVGSILALHRWHHFKKMTSAKLGQWLEAAAESNTGLHLDGPTGPLSSRNTPGDEKNWRCVQEKVEQFQRNSWKLLWAQYALLGLSVGLVAIARIAMLGQWLR